MTQTATIQIVKVEDREGNGECSACGRTGLRWTVIVSDGTAVGTECSKKILGIKISPRDYQWTRDYQPVDERISDGGNHEVLWQHKTRNLTALSVNGTLTLVGGARKEWTQ